MLIFNTLRYSFFPNLLHGVVNTISFILIIIFSLSIGINLSSNNIKSSSNVQRSRLSEIGREDQRLGNLGEEQVLGAKDINTSENEEIEDIPLFSNPFTGETVDEVYIKSNNFTPIAVMIDNSSPAHYVQQNVNKADIVYEGLTEWGITRLMGIYYSPIKEGEDLKIMPVRSIRTNFLDNLQEYNNILIYHVGGANTPNNQETNAVGRILDKKIKSIYYYKGMLYPFYSEEYDPACTNTNIPDYSCKYRTISQLQQVAINNNLEQYNWELDYEYDFLWKYRKIGQSKYFGQSRKGTFQNISYTFSGFSTEEYRAVWQYDSQRKVYLRFTPQNQPRIDQSNNTQIYTENLLVLEKPHKLAVDELHRSVTESNGIGIGHYLSNGEVVEIFWAKKCNECRTRFYYRAESLRNNGGRTITNFDELYPENEIIMNPGKTWVSIINQDQEIEYN